MPGTFTYGLYPWQWLTEAGQSFHAPPTGAASVLDFRPLPAQGTQGQSAGWGLFAWPDGIAPPNDLVSLGSGYIATIQPTTAARNELRLKLGLAQNPAGATLVDCIADVLGSLSDPTGAAGPKPLMPASDGTLEIQLAAHSRVWSLMLDRANLLAANPNSRNNRIRDVIRAGIDTAYAVGGVELAGKVLGSWLLTCGLTREEIKLGAPSKKAQWERLLSAKIKAKHGAAMKPKEPKTQLSETWPTNGAITSGQDQAWAYNTGTPLGGAGMTASGGLVASDVATAVYQAARCTSAVSSANHWTVAPITVGNFYAAGTAARMNATNTFYMGYEWYNDSRYLRKLVAGVDTVLASAAHAGGLSAVNCRTEANGSTISCTITGFGTLSVTDTAITDALLGGIILLPLSGSCFVGAVTIDDGIPDAPVAAFSGTPLSGTSPLSVVFTDSSTNTPTSWLWEKSSDAGSNWSNFASGPTTQNPTESFTVGTWAVRLTATNAGGSDGETKLAYVTVTAAGGAGVSALMLLRGVV